MAKPMVGVLLSGCGVYDGTEIHEAVLTLLAIDRAGAEAVCIAPDVPQLHVVDHRSGEAVGEKRNVLVESARIARGRIREISTVKVREIDSLVLPGGFGAAKNLSDFASAGARCTVLPSVAASVPIVTRAFSLPKRFARTTGAMHIAPTHLPARCTVLPSVARLVRDVHQAGKWVGAMCIAPVVLANLFGNEKARVTIGTDAATAADVEAMGARHVACQPDGVVIDEERRLITTPAYMLATSIAQAAVGIDALVAALMVRVRGGVPVGV